MGIARGSGVSLLGSLVDVLRSIVVAAVSILYVGIVPREFTLHFLAFD